MAQNRPERPRSEPDFLLRVFGGMASAILGLFSDPDIEYGQPANHQHRHYKQGLGPQITCDRWRLRGALPHLPNVDGNSFALDEDICVSHFRNFFLRSAPPLRILSIFIGEGPTNFDQSRLATQIIDTPRPSSLNLRFLHTATSHVRRRAPPPSPYTNTRRPLSRPRVDDVQYGVRSPPCPGAHRPAFCLRAAIAVH